MKLGRDGASERTDVDFFPVHFSAGHAREIKKVVDQYAHALGASADALKMALLRVIELVSTIFEQGLAEAVNTAKRSPQIMGHRITKGFKFLVGYIELCIPELDLLFRQFTFRDVAQDAGEEYPLRRSPTGQGNFNRQHS